MMRMTEAQFAAEDDARLALSCVATHMNSGLDETLRWNQATTSAGRRQAGRYNTNTFA